MAIDLQQYLDQGRRRIDDALETRLPPDGESPELLQRACRYVLMAPGKRLRGIVLLASADLLRGSSEQALPLACGVEMVHAASLILDDLPSMDDATLRRGKPVLHREVGEANAILTAVELLNAGYQAVRDATGLRPRLRVEIADRLGRAIGHQGLIGGQVADLEATGRTLDLEALEYIHSHKTGALFIAAAEMGALSAGAGPKELASLRNYAMNLGLAFQITDDLLDDCGSPEVTGKDAGLDREKTTFVDLGGVEGARRLVDELIDASLVTLDRFGRKAAMLRGLAEMVRERDR